MASLEERDRGWFLWTPDKTESPNNWVYGDIAQAVDAFEPVDRPTGHIAARWLKNEGLKTYPESETWLLYEQGRLEGFFSIRKSGLLVTGKKLPLRRTKPACEITYLCKGSHSDIEGDRLIGRAAVVAAQMWRKRDITLILDPHDVETAKFLCRKYVFWEVTPDYKHLWMPLSIRKGEEPWANGG
jgi:hypothetical protein